MKIDNYNAAKALTKKLKDSLPIKIRAGKQFLKTLKQKGEDAEPDKEFEIDFVGYSGDEGGIMCGLATEPNNPESKEKYVVSLTHLIIDPNHHLASEVQAYQRQRTRKLILQNEAGFAAEFLLAQESGKQESGTKKKRGWGFGK
ncbi:hypothetical protein VB735_12160 [Halotia wernerae UHCC 0503]|nr:hypothetical protein [Halotia wernerae UHCC 0503]